MHENQPKKKQRKKEKAIVAKPLEILSHSLSRKVDSATVNKKKSRKLIFLCYEPPHTLPKDDMVAHLLMSSTNMPIIFFIS